MRLLLFALLSLLALPLRAQDVAAAADLTDWPLSAHEKPVPDRHWRGLDVLPFIERLSLTLVVSDGEAPDVSARLTWRMGREGIKHGRRVPAREMPAGIRLVAFVLRADVMQGGSRVAGLTLAVDSTRLAAGQTLLLEPQADWDVLFDEAGAAAAREIVREGFTLENLRLIRAAFGVFDGETSDAGGVRRERVVNRSVYDAYPGVWVDAAWDLAWLFGTNPRPDYAEGRKLAPRGATGRKATRDEREDDEKDDEEGEFLPAAVGIGVALAAGAVVSGSGGYMVQADEPIGLASGFIRPGGGLVVQASANPQALGMQEGDESLTAQVIGFWGSPRHLVQPAVGLGVRFHEIAGEAHAEAAVTLGGMFRLGRVSLLTGYEIVGQRPAFGLLYTWRRW